MVEYNSSGFNFKELSYQMKIKLINFNYLLVTRRWKIYNHYKQHVFIQDQLELPIIIAVIHNHEIIDII